MKFQCLHFTGVPALTSRNFKETDFVEVINLLDRGIDIAIQAKQKTSKNIHDYHFVCSTL